jgi:hypothetical protein
MKTGIRYVVTKASDDETFEVGNHITLHEDGTILCTEAQGWIEKEEVESSTKGMECEIDREFIDRKRAALERAIAALDAI